MTNQDDPEYAMYIEILDEPQTSFQGNLFNSTTPYTTHKNNSKYNYNNYIM